MTRVELKNQAKEIFDWDEPWPGLLRSQASQASESQTCTNSPMSVFALFP